MEPSRLVRTFRRVCEAHGLRRVRVHDLRDGIGTLLAELGAPIRHAQVVLGHARASTTQEKYQHARMTGRRHWLEKVETAIIGPQTKNDTLGCRSDYGRCRQLSRQAEEIVGNITSVFSGAGGGTLTRGLILGKSFSPTGWARTQSVRRTMEVHTWLWLLGCVAVSTAVKPKEDALS